MKFFLDSLEMVKNEIRGNQRQYLKAAERAFNERMRAAYGATTKNEPPEYPRIRTFAKGTDMTSTNSVFQDLEAAERLHATFSFSSDF